MCKTGVYVTCGILHLYFIVYTEACGHAMLATVIMCSIFHVGAILTFRILKGMVFVNN
jgi:hypothetical protein